MGKAKRIKRRRRVDAPTVEQRRHKGRGFTSGGYLCPCGASEEFDTREELRAGVTRHAAICPEFPDFPELS